MTTIARSAARTGAYSVLAAYRTAHPTQLVHVYDHPPGSYHTPCAFVEKAAPERVTYSASVRQRVIEVTVVVLNRQVDNQQAANEQDALEDGLMDAFTAAARTALPGALMLPASVTDTERAASQGGATYAGFEITLLAEVQEGRTV